MENVKTIVVCTHGASRAGKGTVIQALQKALSSNAKELNSFHVTTVDFADVIRNATTTLLGCSYKQLESSEFRSTPQEKLGGKNPVDFMRLLGTEFVRGNFHEDFWALRWKERVTAITSLCPADKLNVVLVSDARFYNEIAAIYSLPSTVTHHVVISNSNAKFSSHQSDVMNQAWVEYAIAPELVACNEASAISYLSNNGTLIDYANVVQELCSSLCLELHELRASLD